jgi:cell wall assembly regulator SMI1
MTLSISDSAAAVSDADLAAVERRLGVHFPDDYRAFLLRHNGGVPRPGRFRMSRQAAEAGMEWGRVTRFYSVGAGPGEGYKGGDLESIFRTMQEFGFLPDRMVPIALVDDPVDGGTLCISVRGTDRGRVYYHPELEGYDEETGYAVCKSFAAFLDRLAGKTGRAPAWVAAVRGGDLDSLRQWLDGGGDPAERYDGRSPVELAARKGKLELVQFLVGRGAPVGDAYLEACGAGRGEVAHWLFAREPGRKAEPDALTFEQPGLWGELALVRALIDAGADVNHRSPDGTTPLHRAAQHAPPEVVRLLLDRGAELGSFNDRGESALHRVVFADDDPRRLAKMRLLIDAGLELHARHPSKRLPGYSVAELLAGLGDREGLAALEVYTRTKGQGPKGP